MKPQDWQLDPACYPWSDEIALRFGDVDSFGHLNNVAIARLFEETRVRFQFLQYGPQMLEPEQLKKMRMLVAQTNISYLQEGNYPGSIRCAAGVVRQGRTSYSMWMVLWQNGKPLAFQECVMVVTGESGPIPLPDELRLQMQPWIVHSPQG